MSLRAAVRSNRQKVGASEDLKRIKALPRRYSQEDCRQVLTDAFADGLRGMALRFAQATALRELHNCGGLLAPISVGGGKTLVSFLAPTVVEAERSVLVVPASLRSKTQSDFQELRKHWQEPKSLYVISYERLSQKNQVQWLRGIKPDLLILDECHKVKNPKSAARRRIQRYLKEHPDTIVCAMSGTITNRSLRDFAHIAGWCLEESSPTPLDPATVEEWSLALDSEGDITGPRMDVGALLELAGPQDRTSDDLATARRAVSRRIFETAGVVAAQSNDVGSSLTIERKIVNVHSPLLDDHFEKLRDDWLAPDGREIIDGLDVSRTAKQLSLGFYYVWDPQPPEWWLDARRQWASNVRDVLQNNKRELDTELQVWNAVEQGLYDHHPIKHAWERWKQIKDEFTPNTVAVWETDAVVKELAKLAKRAHLVWVQHREIGKALAKELGVPFFADEGYDDNGQHISGWDGSLAVLSISSNSTGRNLQTYHRNLVVEPPANGKAWEQLLGRTHRVGQQADEVYCAWVCACVEHDLAVRKAQSDVEYSSQITGQEQKLHYADKVESVALPKGARWKRK